MQIQCPKCKGWTEDDDGTCDLCGENLHPIDTSQSEKNNPEIQVYLKQKKELRLKTFLGISVFVIAFVGLSFFFVDMMLPGLFTLPVFWMAACGYIKIWSDINTRDYYKEISPPVRRFNIIWLTTNVTAAALMILWLLPGCWKTLYRLMEMVPKLHDYWLHHTLLPLVILGGIVLIWAYCYLTLKDKIAQKTSEKKMLKG